MPPDSLSRRKEDLRSLCKDAVAGIPEERRTAETVSIAERLLASDVIRKSDMVLSYLAFGDELNLDECNRKILEMGKALYVPRIVSSPQEGAAMEFRRIDSELDRLPVNRYGIREPRENSQKLETENLRQVPVLVPGLAFDKGLRRLGRGGGYYDRFLYDNREHIVSIGVCFSVQIVDMVPAGTGDIGLDILVTPHEQYNRV